MFLIGSKNVWQLWLDLSGTNYNFLHWIDVLYHHVLYHKAADSLATVWIISGHVMSAAERVKNQIGVPNWSSLLGCHRISSANMSGDPLTFLKVYMLELIWQADVNFFMVAQFSLRIISNIASHVKYNYFWDGDGSVAGDDIMFHLLFKFGFQNLNAMHTCILS